MKQIELLLLDNVDNLGIIGDVVRVRPGYARNFLLPRGLATTPSEGAIQRLSARRAEVEAEVKKHRSAQQRMMEKLDGQEITMERSANEQGVLFGGVTQHDIGELLNAQGYELIEDRHVRIGQPIKRLDSYQIPIVINKDLKAEIKLWVVSDKPMDREDDGNDDETAEADQATAAA